jgi:hypothetical protein
MPELRCTRIRFWSYGDEEAFFQWARRIPNVKRLYGDHHDIVIVLRSSKVSATTMGELSALFKRYNVPTNRLKFSNRRPKGKRRGT